MPIKVPNNLPALKTLSEEGVDIISEKLAARQDIRPLKLLMLNLMPKKRETEVQFARLFGSSPLQVDMTLLTTETYTPKNTEPGYLRRYYRQLKDVENDYFDALVVTGAPVETLPFEEVQYWKELKEIMQWSITHCFRHLGICWGGQALMYYFFGLEKYLLDKKLFGVYDHHLSIGKSRLMQGFTDSFPMPVSRHTFTNAEDVALAGLQVVAKSSEAGVGMVRCPKSGNLYVLNHLEYDAGTLASEYLRDKEQGKRIAMPVNYFPNDMENVPPVNYWKPFAYLLTHNWLNELYRDTPFDLNDLKSFQRL